MHSLRPSAQPTVRAGYSLLELLLVLGVLAAIAGLSWPALRAALGKSELREAARQLRADLLKTRLRAIESGAAQQFRAQLGQARYEIGPAAPLAEDDLEAQYELDAFASASSREGAANRSPTQASVQHQLADGVCFADPADEGPLPLPNASAEDAFEGDWSAPIVFHPNGAGSNANLRLCGQKNLYVDLTVRGLTGTVRVGPLQRRETP